MSRLCLLMLLASVAMMLVVFTPQTEARWIPRRGDLDGSDSSLEKRSGTPIPDELLWFDNINLDGSDKSLEKRSGSVTLDEFLRFDNIYLDESDNSLEKRSGTAIPDELLWFDNINLDGSDKSSKKREMDGNGCVRERVSKSLWYKDMVDGKLDGSYVWESGAEGKNTIVYVIDTGVMAQHPEFEGRVIQGPDFCPPKRKENRPCTKHDDIYNHGTPISALIVGKTFGMAKQAQVMNVKCSDDRGGMFFSELIQCMEWAIDDSHHYIAAGKRVIFSISQTSMDSAGQKKASFEHLFKTFTNLGIVTVVAAGNFVDQACSFAPGNIGADALTVGSLELTVNDGTWSTVKADHSNYGKCVDMYAPGMNISTLAANGNVVSVHGTSFATPIVAALVANYLSKNTKATAAQVYKFFKEVAVEDFFKEQLDFVLREGQWLEGLEDLYNEMFGPFRRIKFPCPIPNA